LMVSMCVSCWKLLKEYMLKLMVCVHAKMWVVCSELTFTVESCVLQRNCDLLSKLCRLQRISIRCRNWVVCSELAFAAESCVLQWNCDSLSKLCRPQWIGICYQMACFAAKLWFAAETVSAAAN
jgi:hypothetical protein